MRGNSFCKKNKNHSTMPWKYIKASQFFPNYCPDIKDFRKKITGRNGRGNPIEFTPDDLQKIRQGLARMYREIISQVGK